MRHKRILVLLTAAAAITAVGSAPGVAQSLKNSPGAVNAGQADPGTPTYPDNRRPGLRKGGGGSGNDAGTTGSGAAAGGGAAGATGATGAAGATGGTSGAAGGAAGGAGAGGAGGAGGGSGGGSQ